MNDYDRMFHDLSIIRSDSGCEKILHYHIKESLRIMRRFNELYADPEKLSGLMLFFMFRAFEDIIDYYEIKTEYGEIEDADSD